MIHANAGYGAAARLYREAGWSAVLPLPRGQKTPPPDGFTGRQAADPTEEQIVIWASRYTDGNLALRMPAGVVGIDVDAYGSKRGGQTLNAAEGQWGPLPATWRSTSRPEDAESGIRYFRIPAGAALPGQIELGVNGSRTGDIEIVQRHHRYAVVPPSIHPEGRHYVWFRPDGAQALEGEVPSPDGLPELPQTWLAGLLAQHGEGDPRALLEALPSGEPCARMRELRQKALDACQGPSRHDNVSRRLLAILRLGERGHPGAPAVLHEVRAAFCQAVAKDRQGGGEEAVREINRMLAGGARIVANSPTPDSERGCFCGQTPDQAVSDAQAMSDAHLADVVIADVLLGRWLWSDALSWLYWDGRRWRLTPVPTLYEEVRQYLLSRYEEARTTAQDLSARIDRLEAHRGMARANGGGAPSAQEIEELAQRRKDAEQEAKQWFATLSRARITSISDLTKGRLTCDATELDAKPDLLNVENGIVDLSTGRLLEHDPQQLLSKLAPVRYRPGATHPDWEKALMAVPEDVRDWYQLRLGQAITGHIPPDDLLVVQVGTGENGKTTLMSGVQAVLGDYFVLASERVLIADPTAHPTELMDLRGARLALIEETPEERRLSISRLKKVVGNPSITARRIRENPVTFAATHALFVSTNYLPIVEETDHGTWRRLACLRFPYLFRKPGQAPRGPEDRPGDPDLRQRLKEGREGQHEATLAWLVEGARRWYAAGRRMSLPPARIVDDTRDWQRYSDLFLAYVDEQLVYDPDRHVMSRELLAHFNAWLTERGHRPWSDRTFNKRIEEHHETSARQVVRKVLRLDLERLSRPQTLLETDLPKQYHAWLGVRFRTDDDPAGSGRPSDHPSQPSQPSQPPGPNGSRPVGAGGQVIEMSRHSRHSTPAANSKAAGVTAVTASLVDAENGDSLAHVIGGQLNDPSQPSQPSQAGWVAPVDASRPLATEPPAVGADAATPAAQGCRHPSQALGSGLIRCLDCGATRSPGQPWPGERPDATTGGEEVSHDCA